MTRWPAALALAVLAAPSLRAQDTPVGPSTVLDAFESLDGWSAHPSDGTSLQLRSDSGATGRSMRLDFDFHGGGGYVIARKVFDLRLPANYELTYRLRGAAPRNTIEFKLVDTTGDNVWWNTRRDVVFPPQWTTMRIKRRQVSFAWGPRGGGELERVAAIEIAITAGSGGKGSVWLDELTLVPRARASATPPAPRLTASSETVSGGASLAMDGDTTTTWRSASGGAGDAWLDIDLGANREFGGLVIDWDDLDYATDYTVETSADGTRWERVAAVTAGDGGRDHIALPESESRHVRLRLGRSSRGHGDGIREVRVQPLAWAATPNAFAFAVARDATRGDYPRAFTDSVQTYWTVVGAPAAEREALINEEGSVEVGKQRFSIEPFVYSGRLITWADAHWTQSLERGDLPIPHVRWDADSLALTVTPWVVGAGDSATLFVRYRVENPGPSVREATLFLALRPFQVNPPWQFLNTPGGTAELRSIRRSGRTVRINDGPAAGGDDIILVSAPSAFGAAAEPGALASAMRRGMLPALQVAGDSAGRATGALAYRLVLPAGGSREIVLAVSFGAPGAAVLARRTRQAGDSLAARTYRETVASWSRRLDRVTIVLPRDAEPVARAIRSELAYILINQDGPGIQPDSRAYERSWIRDGSLTAEALLRLGQAERARAFLEWYAPFQYANGKVPCCVDRRGADPVPEHDSHGQLIYLIAEYYRYTGDRATLARMWPHVARAVAYIDSLRHERMTDEYRAPEKRAFFGMMPQSISHEGYSAKAMHSYWDDFFTLRGLKDAAAIAHALGKSDTARYERIRDEFRRDLIASFAETMRVGGIDYLPGSVELGDFDATSTTVGVSPGGEIASLQPALGRTFDRYFENFHKRRDADTTWDAYTPYEWRTVGTLVRLGQRERAHEVLDWFMRDRRPLAWNHWAEVVYRVPGKAQFIGDMPHTWVGSDFIRSVLDMFAYERESDSSLVIGAGVPERWMTADSGVVVRGLRTPYGGLNLTMRARGDTARIVVTGSVRPPRGGIAVRSPWTARAATANGAPATLNAEGEAIVRRLPATVVFIR